MLPSVRSVHNDHDRTCLSVSEPHKALPALLERLESLQAAERSKRVFVVVIGAGSRRFGLAVDKLMGEEELVIKALEDELITSPMVSGASILGDGTVVLILNVSAVVSHLSRIPAVGAIA